RFCSVANPATIERLLLRCSGGPKEKSDGTADELGMRLVFRGSRCLDRGPFEPLGASSADRYAAMERVSPPSDVALIGIGTPGSHFSIISTTVSFGVP